jgi:hypothetical protein
VKSWRRASGFLLAFRLFSLNSGRPQLADRYHVNRIIAHEKAERRRRSIIGIDASPDFDRLETPSRHHARDKPGDDCEVFRRDRNPV